MKLGIASSLVHENPEEWAMKHKEYGCESVVFPVDYTASKELIDKYVKAAKTQGLTIAEVGSWCNLLSSNREVRAAAKLKCIEQLKLADYVKANCCVNVTGSRGLIWDGAHKDNLTDETWKMAVQVIQEILDAVKPQNTYYAVEAMPWMFPIDPEQYLKLIQEVDREQFGVHIDVVNWITNPLNFYNQSEFIEKCFEKLGDKVKSCHLKDIYRIEDGMWHVNEVECGKGNLDIKKYVKTVDSVNENIPMIIEHLDSDEKYYRALEYIKKRV